jgi:hypothetical protein
MSHVDWLHCRKTHFKCPTLIAFGMSTFSTTFKVRMGKNYRTHLFFIIFPDAIKEGEPWHNGKVVAL